MAWSSQSSHVPGPTSLPLYKLSFCTTVALRSNLVWNHLPQRDNLFAVFDHVTRNSVEGFISQKRTLKLVRGGEVLENIELDNLALQARLDDERNKSQRLEDADRYVILLIKRPLLAMRYQLSDGHIRRLQLNFSPESGYDTALNVLQGLGLPIRDKNPPAIQPTSAPPRAFQPSQHMLPPPKPVRLQPSPNFTYRPNTSDGYDYRPSSSAPEMYTERPYSAPDPISFSQMLPPRRELPPGMRLLMSNSKRDTEAPVQTAQDAEPKQSSAKPPAKRKAQAKPTKPKAAKKKSPEPPKVRIEKSNITHDTFAESGIEKSLQVANSTPAQKKKAPAQISKPQTTATEPNSGIPNSSLSPVAKDAGSPFLRVPRTIGPIELALKQGREAAAPARPSAEETNPTEPPASTTEGRRQPLVLRPGRQVMAEITSNTPNPNPVRPAPATTTTPIGASAESRPRPDAEEISPSEFMSSLDAFVREYQHLPAPRPPPTAAEDLAAYAAQPDEVRQAVIKDLILECLGNENFVKLVEDVDGEWRRIGLGF